MKFNYFRVLVTILAAFGAFFSYICRLNLSLAIEKMVVENDNVQEISLDNQLVTTKTNDTAVGSMIPSQHLLSSYYDRPFIQTEEHAFASIFSKTIKLSRQVGAKAIKSRRKINIPPRLRPHSPLSIDIDTSGNDYQPTTNQTESGSNGSDEMVQVQNQSDLLKWDEKQRTNLLGAFFLGYVIFQIPLARAAEIFGPKILFVFIGFGCGLTSLAFPYFARLTEGIWPAYLLRMAMGGVQSALFPTSYVLICHWMPLSERPKWLPYPASFSRIGTIVMNMCLPAILRTYGWEATFYVSGAITLVWTLLFIVFGANSPNDSYWISKEELIYIESHKEPRVGSVVAPSQKEITGSGFTINEASDKQAKPSISWMKVIKNKPILILALVMFSSEWSNMLFLVKLPGFLNRALGFEIEEISLWSSILVFIFCIQYPMSSYLASKMDQSFEPLRVRKIFEVAAHLMQATGCVLIAFYSDKAIVLGSLVLMMFGRSTVGGGQCLIPAELSKDYPGTVFAYANTLANLAGVLGPWTINQVVANQKEYSSWFWLWIISCGIFIFCGTMFCLFADNCPQNYGKKVRTKGPGQRTFSEAQLTLDKDPNQIFKMEAFSRVSSEPNPQQKDHQKHLD